MFELFAISLQIKIGVSLQIDWHPAMNLIKIQCESHLNLYFELNMDPVQSQKGMQSSAVKAAVAAAVAAEQCWCKS